MLAGDRYCERKCEDRECQGSGRVGGGGVVAVLYIKWSKKGLFEGNKGVSHVETWERYC